MAPKLRMKIGNVWLTLKGVAVAKQVKMLVAMAGYEIYNQFPEMEEEAV